MTDLFTKVHPTKPVDPSRIQKDDAGKPYTILKSTCYRCGGSGRYGNLGVCYGCAGRGTRGSKKHLCFTAEQITAHLAKSSQKAVAKAAAARAEHFARVRAKRATRGATLTPAKAAIKAAWPHRKVTILRDILKSVLRSGVCSEKQAAVLFKIANERDAKAVARPSEHVGVVGERETFVLTLKRNIDIDTRFGAGTIRIFEDAAGNVVKSFGTVPEPWDVGATKTIVATVKKHGDYKGSKETIINRLALPKDKPAKANKSRTTRASVWST